MTNKRLILNTHRQETTNDPQETSREQLEAPNDPPDTRNEGLASLTYPLEPVTDPKECPATH